MSKELNLPGKIARGIVAGPTIHSFNQSLI
jgi:hypothetical protein